MPYIGTSPSQGVRRVHTYTATANQTSFSGAGAEGATLSYKDSNFVDVYQNGVKLGDADYTATSGTAIVLGTGATVSDLVVIVAYDVFSAADTVSKADGGQFDGAVTFAGGITGPLAINDGDAGSVTANTVGDELVIESSGAGGLSILTPNASDAQVLLGGPDTNAGAILRWNDDANLVSLGTNNTGGTLALKVGGFSDALTIDASANVTITGDIRKSTSGTSNFAAGVNAGNSIASGGNFNTVVGDEAGTALTTGDDNTALGYGALYSEDAHGKNTAIGTNSLLTLNAGADGHNTAVGYFSGKLITTGLRNTIVGSQAGDALTTSADNVAVGTQSLSAETTGLYSVAVGQGALASQNNSGDAQIHNVAVGYQAGVAITTGIQNTLVGSKAGDALTDADFNIALGMSALGTDTKGNKSVAIGVGALSTQNFTSSTDSLNTAVGHSAGNAITTGIQNTLIGGLAGDALTDADKNVAVGRLALSTDTQGSKSTAIGWNALATQNFSSATDSHNTAVGYSAGSEITTGIRNTIMGSEAGDALTDADYNIAIGYQALSQDTQGSRSVAIGYQALEVQNFTSATDSKNVAVGFNCGVAVSTGTLNTFVGYSAGSANTTGYDNIVIGRNGGDGTGNAGGSAMVTGYRNILIGNEGSLSATDGVHQITLGSHITGANSSFTFGNGGTDSRISVGATSITAPSDERYKEEITTSTAGLSFINDLRPVTFKWKKEKDIPTDHRAYVANSDKRVMERGEKVNHGFIAQEVKTAIDNHSEIKDGFDMWQVDDSDGRQRLAPSELIPMLVKAIQELSAEVTALKGE